MPRPNMAFNMPRNTTSYTVINSNGQYMYYNSDEGWTNLTTTTAGMQNVQVTGVNYVPITTEEYKIDVDYSKFYYQNLEYKNPVKISIEVKKRNYDI